MGTQTIFDWKQQREREFFIDNSLVRIHCIIVMIRWTGLAPWKFESPFPGSITSTFLRTQIIFDWEQPRCKLGNLHLEVVGMVIPHLGHRRIGFRCKREGFIQLLAANTRFFNCWRPTKLTTTPRLRSLELHTAAQ